MKSLAFFALSAIATVALADPAPAPMSSINISGTSSQTVSVNGGATVMNTANDHTYANQNIASNKGGINISGSSTQTSTIDGGATVSNEAVLNGDVAVQNLASNVGTVNVAGTYSSGGMLLKGSSSQTANVGGGATVSNWAEGLQGCRGSDCKDAALAYQNLASNMGDITISGSSTQTVGVGGGSSLTNEANGAKTAAVQNVASNYGTVNISGTSTQAAYIDGGSTVANLATGRLAHAVQNLASNDSCMPPPPICVGPACGPYAFNSQ